MEGLANIKELLNILGIVQNVWIKCDCNRISPHSFLEVLFELKVKM